MSRVQKPEQLYILEELPEDKIYANHAAMEEIDRLINVSRNKNPTEWDKENEQTRLKICFLNCRSILNKIHNIRSDKSLLKSDVLILIETWLTGDTDLDQYALQNYDTSFNNRGRGKGIASYFKGDFASPVNINDEGFSITKLGNEKLNIIGVYRSQTGDLRHLTIKIQGLVDTEVTTAHIDGGVIDHMYILQGKQIRFESALELMPKYFSDHDGVCLTIWEYRICISTRNLEK